MVSIQNLHQQAKEPNQDSWVPEEPQQVLLAQPRHWPELTLRNLSLPLWFFVPESMEQVWLSGSWQLPGTLCFSVQSVLISLPALYRLPLTILCTGYSQRFMSHDSSGWCSCYILSTLARFPSLNYSVRRFPLSEVR